MWLRKLLVGAMALVVGCVVIVVIGAGALLVATSNGAMEIPQLREQAALQLADRFDAPVGLETISIARDPETGQPQLRAANVDIRRPDGSALIRLPEARTNLALADILRGKLRPADVDLAGLTLRATLHPDGRLDFGDNLGESEGELSFARFERLMRSKGGSALQELVLRDSRLLLLDVARDRTWDFAADRIALTRDGDDLSFRGSLRLDTVGQVSLTATHRLGADRADLRIQLAQTSPAAVAQVVRPLEWLAMIDAQVSGSASIGLTEGGVDQFAGVLDLGQGKIVNIPQSSPIRFEKAKTYFEYDPEADEMRFPSVEVETQFGRFAADGYATLDTGPDGHLRAMAGQFQFNDIWFEDADLLERPLQVDHATVDLRLRFDPLVLDIGALTATLGQGQVRARGRSEAKAGQWNSAYDIDIDALGRDAFLALWPLPVIDKTRLWISENILEGDVHNMRGGFRVEGDADPQFAFNFDFDNALVRTIPALPLLEKAKGFGYLTQDEFHLDLLSGGSVAADGGWVDLAGSRFFVPDINEHPTPGEIRLRTRSGVQSALELLNVEEFGFLDQVGLSPDIAQGTVEADGLLKLPLDKDVRKEEVIFDATARVLSVRSDTIAEGRRIFGRDLDLEADNDGLHLSGPAELDGVPLRFAWHMPFDTPDPDSTLTADVVLTDANLKKLGIVLPDGFLRDSTPAKFELDMPAGADPAYRLTSALRGARLAVPSIGWSKARDASGVLEVRGKLAETPSVDYLHLDAAGLSASGDLRLKGGSALEVLRLSDVKIGRWLDGAAQIVPTANGARISVTGGSLDLRHIGALDSAAGGSSGGSDTITIDLSLDKLTVTEDIALTNFVAELTTQDGLRGDFIGRVNGGPPVQGKIFPHEGRSGVEFNSDRAGAVVAAANLLDNAHDGDMKVLILPRAGSEAYDGVMQVKRVRLQQANGIANLLNALSVVGLMQQLEGEGIHFETVEGKFELYPDYVRLHDVSAVGPSMGLTLDGLFDTNARAVNFEGVVTPLYLVNGLFQTLFGPLGGRRKGEGLFSFTYNMEGAADDPRVGVNPLSILTPGAFREIFRRAPPTRPGEVAAPAASGNQAAQISGDER